MKISKESYEKATQLNKKLKNIKLEKDDAFTIKWRFVFDLEG